MLLADNSSHSRPISPPFCKVKKKTSNRLLVLPPENSSVQFNVQAEVPIKHYIRHGSAERVQRKLNSFERSNSAGGRLCIESKYEEDQRNLKISPTSIKTDAIIDDQKDLSRPSEENHVSLVNNTSKDLPIELKAEFLSCVMAKKYEKALVLCNEILTVDPSDEVCVEYQNVLVEKINEEQFTSDASGKENESDHSESETEDDESEEDESDSDDDSDSDDGEDSCDEFENENSSDSDVDVPLGPINLLMGGLPVRS